MPNTVGPPGGGLMGAGGRLGRLGMLTNSMNQAMNQGTLLETRNHHHDGWAILVVGRKLRELSMTGEGGDYTQGHNGIVGWPSIHSYGLYI